MTTDERETVRALVEAGKAMGPYEMPPNGGLLGWPRFQDALAAVESLLDQPEPPDLLGELLAVIHRDGGHYRQQHGTAKAVSDAIEAVSRLRAELDCSRDDMPSFTARMVGAVERARPMCADHRDKFYGQPCLGCQLETESRYREELKIVARAARQYLGDPPYHGYEPNCMGADCRLIDALARPAVQAILK